MSARTKADLERENARLKEENENLRYAMSQVLEAGRAERDVHRLQAEASGHLLDAIGVFTAPTIPNN